MSHLALLCFFAVTMFEPLDVDAHRTCVDVVTEAVDRDGSNHDLSLLVALAYGESRFEHEAVSNTNRIGVLQITPLYYCPDFDNDGRGEAWYVDGFTLSFCDTLSSGVDAFESWYAFAESNSLRVGRGWDDERHGEPSTRALTIAHYNCGWTIDDACAEFARATVERAESIEAAALRVTADALPLPVRVP